MTIIAEEKLSVRADRPVSFASVKAEVIAALQEDRKASALNQEKIRLARSGVTFKEFKGLVETIDLVPVQRGRRTASSHTVNED
jgi:hypothetical protein